MTDKSSSASGLVVGDLGGDGDQLLEDGHEDVFSRAEVDAGKGEHGVEAGAEVSLLRRTRALTRTPASPDRMWTLWGLPAPEVAKALIGARLLVDGVGGIIVETEAYDRFDPASHSFSGPTPRNAPMFGPVGHVYVYRIYGLHWCLNIVCNQDQGGSAVLIRALEPERGLDLMRERRGERRGLCSGPGRLCQALGVTGALNGLPISLPPFSLTLGVREPMVAGVRIGIRRGAQTPWRFGRPGSPFLSRPFESAAILL